MSFVFYDTETTGTDTAFDQILQFGAIRTDYELNELDRFEIRCRLLPYVVPSPGALVVNGITVGRLLDSALPTHYQMVRAIRAKLAEWSPAIFLGHNSLGFDEHLLRQAFYKTLHDPYLTNKNGNCRLCVLRMARAVACIAPGALSVPFNGDGTPSFNLERLAAANGFQHGGAHDAIADAEATIHMCRVMAERVPAYWSNFLRFSKKASVTDFATGEEFFALTDFYGTRSYSWMVTVLGVNPDNGSEQIVFCLSSDPGELAVMSDEELVARLSEFPKPVRGMRTNSCPIVLSYEDSPEAIRSAAPALPVLKERAALVRNDKQFAGRLVQAFIRSRGERETSPHVEGRIYDGFAGNEDNAVMDRFHALEWAHRAPLIGQLADERLRSLGQRLIYVEAPHVMSDEERRDYDVAIARRLMAEEGSVPWRTYPQAIAETDGLLADDCGPNAVLLAEFQHYLAGRAEEAASQFSV